jgi:error-prone DNA polymerase
MTANVITYRGRSAAREVGKALGVEAAQIDRLAKVMNQFEFVDPADTLRKRMVDAGCDLDHPTFRWFAEIWTRMQDLPRHLGQHSGGMVVCQGQLDSVVPLENASMPGRVVLQWDKDDCAEMGLVKVDLLGLGMMAVLQDAIQLVDGAIDLAHLPPDDPAVYKMLQEADTIGVFQVESRAQMATLPRMHPERFYDLVVEVAIIRPGPIVGNMVHPYLNRRAGREPVSYAHPSLEPILERTLGVPLFQEQLLRMAMVTAGFTGGQAEDLRRALGFKRSETRMRQVEIALRAGMTKNGITGDTAEEIISSITAFALYGFPESHAASFALLAYASAYLKAHFPAAFYTALLNNYPMGFYHPATLVKDAQRRGVRFSPVDVQHSDWLCRVETDGSVRLGLRYVSGLREDVGRAIETAGRRTPGARSRKCEAAVCPKCGCDDRSMIETVRTGNYFCNTCAHDWNLTSATSQLSLPMSVSRFRSVDDLVTQTGIHRDELQTLADIGAFASFGYERREALWQVEKAVRPAGELFSQPEARSPKPEAGSEPEASPLPAMNAEDRLVADYAGMQFTIGPHPMAMRRAELAMRGVLRAVDLPRARNGRRIRVAGTVITRQRPGTAKGFVFLTLEDETGIANIIVRPDLFDRDRLTVMQQPFLLVDGILQNQDGVTSVKAERLHALRGIALEIESHDFH